MSYRDNIVKTCTLIMIFLMDFVLTKNKYFLEQSTVYFGRQLNELVILAGIQKMQCYLAVKAPLICL